MRAQSYADPQHEIRLSSDIDGDGTYKGISSKLLFSILPAKLLAYPLQQVRKSRLENPLVY